MDKGVSLIIGIFLFSLFGNVANNMLYYFIFIFRFIFDLIYYIGDLLSISSFGIALISIGFYSLVLFIFKFILDLFIKS